MRARRMIAVLYLHGDLHGVLALLDDPDVTEIVLASGQPVTVRRHGGYRQVDPAPLSVDDILDLAGDSPLAPMLERGDGDATVQVHGRHVRIEIHRFGERVMVRLLRGGRTARMPGTSSDRTHRPHRPLRPSRRSRSNRARPPNPGTLHRPCPPRRPPPSPRPWPQPHPRRHRRRSRLPDRRRQHRSRPHRADDAPPGSRCRRHHRVARRFPHRSPRQRSHRSRPPRRPPRCPSSWP